MLPDIGASELMVVALVALVFVGPKDLPLMLKRLGQFTSRMRRMAADFRTSFDDMARQSELDDLRKEVEQMRSSAAQAVSDPIGVESALRDTMQEVDAAMTDSAAYDYDPGVPVAEAPAAEAPKTPKTTAKKPAPRKTAAAKSEAPAPKPRKAAKTKAASSTTAPEAPAKPRRRSASKIVN